MTHSLFLMALGVGAGLAGLIVIAACVAMLFCTVKDEITRLDESLAHGIMIGFVAVLVGIVLIPLGSLL
jgi:hypothetical protein